MYFVTLEQLKYVILAKKPKGCFQFEIVKNLLDFYASFQLAYCGSTAITQF